MISGGRCCCRAAQHRLLQLRHSPPRSASREPATAAPLARRPTWHANVRLRRQTHPPSRSRAAVPQPPSCPPKPRGQGRRLQFFRGSARAHSRKTRSASPRRSRVFWWEARCCRRRRRPYGSRHRRRHGGGAPFGTKLACVSRSVVDQTSEGQFESRVQCSQTNLHHHELSPKHTGDMTMLCCQCSACACIALHCIAARRGQESRDRS